MEVSFPNWFNSATWAASCFEMDVVRVQTYKSTQCLILYNCNVHTCLCESHKSWCLCCDLCDGRL